MSPEMVEYIIGEPSHKNIATTQYSESEQWVYKRD